MVGGEVEMRVEPLDRCQPLGPELAVVELLVGGLLLRGGLLVLTKAARGGDEARAGCGREEEGHPKDRGLVTTF